MVMRASRRGFGTPTETLLSSLGNQERSPLDRTSTQKGRAQWTSTPKGREPPSARSHKLDSNKKTNVVRPKTRKEEYYYALSLEHGL